MDGANIFGVGANPGLAAVKFYNFRFFIPENKFGLNAIFMPCSFDDFAILENMCSAAAGGGEVAEVCTWATNAVDGHRNYNVRAKLHALTI